MKTQTPTTDRLRQAEAALKAAQEAAERTRIAHNEAVDAMRNCQNEVRLARAERDTTLLPAATVITETISWTNGENTVKRLRV